MIIEIGKEETKDRIEFQCGLGCKVVIETVDKYTDEDKDILTTRCMDNHNLIFHGLKTMLNIEF